MTSSGTGISAGLASHHQKDTTLTKIFVGGLPYHTTDESLRRFFDHFGPIEEAVVITDRQTGKSRGYGFVTMARSEDALLAIRDPNPCIDGRKANVNLAVLGAKPRLMPGASSAFTGYMPLQTGFTSLNSVTSVPANLYSPTAASTNTSGLFNPLLAANLLSGYSLSGGGGTANGSVVSQPAIGSLLLNPADPRFYTPSTNATTNLLNYAQMETSLNGSGPSTPGSTAPIAPSNLSPAALALLLSAYAPIPMQQLNAMTNQPYLTLNHQQQQQQQQTQPQPQPSSLLPYTHLLGLSQPVNSNPLIASFLNGYNSPGLTTGLGPATTPNANGYMRSPTDWTNSSEATANALSAAMTYQRLLVNGGNLGLPNGAVTANSVINPSDMEHVSVMGTGLSKSNASYNGYTEQIVRRTANTHGQKTTMGSENHSSAPVMQPHSTITFGSHSMSNDASVADWNTNGDKISHSSASLAGSEADRLVGPPSVGAFAPDLIEQYAQS